MAGKKEVIGIIYINMKTFQTGDMLANTPRLMGNEVQCRGVGERDTVNILNEAIGLVGKCLARAWLHSTPFICTSLTIVKPNKVRQFNVFLHYGDRVHIYLGATLARRRRYRTSYL